MSDEADKKLEKLKAEKALYLKAAGTGLCLHYLEDYDEYMIRVKKALKKKGDHVGE